MADPSIVQWKTSTEVAAAVTTASVTLDSAPTPGNLLLAVCFLTGTPGTAYTATPTGFSLELAYTTAANQIGMRILSRIAQVGDTAGPYTITTSAGSYYPRITVLEITNQSILVDWRAHYQDITYTDPHTFTTRAPSLILDLFNVGTTGTTGQVGALAEPYWTTVVPLGTGGAVNSNHRIASTLLSEATAPSGGTVTYNYTTTVSNTNFFIKDGLIAIRGEPAPPATSDVQIVQKKVSARSTTTTASLTLDTTPTPGNLLLALMAWKGNTADDLTDVAGWTEQFEQDRSTGNIHTMWLSHIVQAGDGTSVSFTINPAGQTTTSQPILYVFEIKNQGSGTSWRGGFGNAGTAATAPFTYTLPTTTKPALILFAWESIYDSGGNVNRTPVPPSESGWATYVHYSGKSYVTTSTDFGGYAHIFAKTQPGATLPHGQPEAITTGVTAGNPATGSQISYAFIYPGDTGTVSAFVDYTAAEVVSSTDPTTIESRVDHVATEVVTSTDPAILEARVDHVVSEVVYSAPAEANVDAVQSEVVVPYIPPPAELQVTSVDVEVVSVYPLAANTEGANVDTVVLETVVHYPLQANSDGLNVTNITLEAVLAHGAVPILPPANPLIPMIC